MKRTLAVIAAASMLGCFTACEDYNTPGNFVSGANIAGFRRVVKALRAQGYV